MRRFEILWLHSCGKFAPEIAEIVKQTPSTVRKVINKFKQGGITLVTTIDSNHPKSDLEEHRVSVIEEFKKRPSATAKEAAYRIEKLTGVKRSEQRIRIFMRNIGMTFRKVAAVPRRRIWTSRTILKKRFGA